MPKSNNPKIDPRLPRAKPTVKTVKAAVATPLSDLCGRRVFVVRTCVRLHKMIDGTRMKNDVIHTSLHAAAPTVDSILDATRHDPIKATMHEFKRYMGQLSDCLHTYGVPDVLRANGDSGTVANYNADVVAIHWSASVENDDCGHSAIDKELGYIAISCRTIWP